ncbi:MAG TPA: helix-turn-helix transcriptional regulator [Candidatus Choladousia intestinigallinarum]|nr:helix-turn-helix transcriptional regulator [Candidatus Choladousia intestinigallinarum]
MTQIIDWLQENYRQPLTLSQAALHLGLSKEYFCRIFRQYTGETFLEYLYLLRTISFYQELPASDLSIPLLMEKNGITNYKVFLRVFKKLYGTTPQKARRRL